MVGAWVKRLCALETTTFVARTVVAACEASKLHTNDGPPAMYLFLLRTASLSELRGKHRKRLLARLWSQYDYCSEPEPW